MENAKISKIQQLKKEKNAVILAHFYTSDEIQQVADYVGDSYYLAKVAKEIEQDTIVFAGVSFMGESAKVLNPQKKVLMPDLTADCAMAHMVKEGIIDEMRAKYSDLAVVCYVNSSIELKCQSDVCVTSSNAVKIVKNLPNKNIFFIPDENLGRFVSEKVPEKNIILNDGYCPIHKAMTLKHLRQAKEKYPNALVLTHPESIKKVVDLSDFVGSTAEIIEYAKNSDRQQFIICTEIGVLCKLKKDNPNKQFYFVDPRPVCVDMKKNTLDGIINVLESGANEIIIDSEKIERALKPLDMMLQLAK